MGDHSRPVFISGRILGGRSAGFGRKATNPGHPLLCNLALTPLGTKLDEGCLSVTGMRSLVPRHRELHYRGVDAPGPRFDRTVPDFHVRMSSLMP